MNAALCIGGEIPRIEKVKKILADMDIVAAADSGFDALYEAGLEADLVFGDMDSTQYREIIEALPSKQREIVPAEKDETDTEIGLRRLQEMGAERVTIIGGGGGRLDHLLGIVLLFDREIRPWKWYTARELIRSVEEELTIAGMKGRTVSLFPVGAGRCRMKSSGLKWPLDELVWKKGDAGISNVVTDETLKLEPIEGRAILICSCEEHKFG